MPKLTRMPRRLIVSSHADASASIDKSNTTLNVFLGGRHKSWMNGIAEGDNSIAPDRVDADGPPSAASPQGRIEDDLEPAVQSPDTTSDHENTSVPNPTLSPQRKSQNSIPSPPLSPDCVEVVEDGPATATATEDGTARTQEAVDVLSSTSTAYERMGWVGAIDNAVGPIVSILRVPSDPAPMSGRRPVVEGSSGQIDLSLQEVEPGPVQGDPPLVTPINSSFLPAGRSQRMAPHSAGRPVSRSSRAQGNPFTSLRPIATQNSRVGDATGASQAGQNAAIPLPGTSHVHNTVNTNLPPLNLPALQLSDREAIDADARLLSFASASHMNVDNMTQIRVELIRHAVRQHDTFCLTIHQILCLCVCDVSKLPATLTNIAGFQLAMHTVDVILGGTANMPREICKFLSEFPCPIEQYPWQNPQNFARMMEAFHQFILRTKTNWYGINAHYTRLGTAPLAIELYHLLGIQSRILMTIVFRSLLRQIWGTQLLTNRLVNDMFEQAVVIHEQDSANLWTANSVGQAQSDVWLQSIRQQFKMRHEKLQALQRSQAAHYQQAFLPKKGFFGPSAQQAAHAQPPHQNVPNRASMQAQPTMPLLFPNAIAATQVLPTQTGRMHMPHVVAVAPIAAQATSSVAAAQPRHSATRPVPSPLLQSSIQQPGAQIRPSQELFIPAQGQLLNQPAVSQESWALHKALIRSPKLVAIEDPQASPDRLYQSLESFALKPTRLSGISPANKFSFYLSHEDVSVISKSLPPATPSQDGCRPTRMVGPGTRQYRLRMCKLASDRTNVAKLPIGQWALGETSWVRHVHITLNDHHQLELRRKIHFAKDLPVDIVQYLRPGDHHISIGSICDPKDLPNNSSFAIAVEIAQVRSLAQIQSEVAARQIPAEETLARIKQRVRPPSTEADDDDLMIVSSTLTIQLFEPFMNRHIFTTPVRGAACTHIDCFDLDVWLATRPAKAPAAGQGAPSTVDDWRCPICRGDARPQALVVDGFLVDVRAQLAAKDALDTRFIVVKEDGSWEPKVEEVAEPQKGTSASQAQTIEDASQN